MKGFVFVGVSALLSVASITCNGAVVRKLDAPFEVRYKNGTMEHFIARYEGIVESQISETGHPSEPLKGWFVDNRQCHLAIKEFIDRQVCQTSQAFGPSCISPFSHQYFFGVQNNAPGWSLTRIQGKNCGEARADYEREISSEETKLSSQFGSFVNKNLNEFFSELRDRPTVIDVTQSQ